MAAYRADIEIGVLGARNLEQLRSSINLTAKAVDSLNDVVSSRGSLVQNIQNYTNNLNRAARSLQLVGAGTFAETKAIKEYVRALGEANAARARQNSLVAQELANQRRVVPGNAGYGQQGPALPPSLIRTQQIQQNWNKFFQDAAAAGQELQTTSAAKSINIKANWNRFFQDAAVVAQDIQGSAAGKAANIRNSWGRFFQEATAVAQDLQSNAAAKTINVKTSWTRFFQEAQNVAAELTAQAQRTTAAIRAREAAASTGARQRLIDEAARRQLIQNAGVGVQGPALPPVSSRSVLSGRAGGAISSALIGGGFPLLFGQGPTAAIGGAAGGLAGGLLGGGFGFALSIVGTALGDAATKADAFNKQLAVLNSSIANTSNATKITSKDVENLAKNLGIASDEAVKLLSNFSGFSNASITKALAFVYGDDTGTLKSLAAVKDKADLAQIILGSYEKITVETANQLINQLKISDASTVELAFQKALLEARVRQTEEGLKQITIQDRIIAGLASIGSLGAGGPVIDPAVFGQGRVAEFRKNNPVSSIFSNALQGLRQLRTATQGAQSFQPDRGAAKAARDAERERERVALVVRDRNAEAAILRIQSKLQEKIAAAEIKKDPILVARLQGEERILEIQYQYAQALANEKDIQAQIAITNAARAAVSKQQVVNELRINAIYAEREELVKDTITQLDNEIAIKYATTDTERSRLKIEQEIAALRKQGITDETVLVAIAARKAELAKPIMGTDLIRQQIGSLSDELTKLVDIGTQITQIAENIGTSFANSFKGAISGAMTAQEALASFFQSVADRFLDMAAQIIAKWIEMTLLNNVLNLFPGGSVTSKGNSDVLANFNAAVLQYRASGGPVSTGSPYMVGERGPELFVPGRSGTIVPNNALGGGDNFNVVVNVDASGSKVQGDGGQAGQLAKAVSIAVQQELIKHKRPGGILA